MLGVVYNHKNRIKNLFVGNVVACKENRETQATLSR